ncbi:MAG: hypothetical protein A2X22_13205 [Bacteroidetes bacterium GWF2_49_14]|nr:MAG: hypothetical protein A2X22_13205 [Bacteroidetes bacterium GWF2_49_14]
MNRRNCLILCGILSLSACNSKDVRTGIPSIDIAEGLKETGNLKLSELASDPEIVLLESGADSWFVNASSLSIGKKYMMILDDMEKRIILFDRQGKYIRQIGRKGKGPGEFNNLHHAAMDPNEQFVFIHDGIGQKLIKYNTDGAFVGEVSTKKVCFEEWFVDGIQFINDEQFVLVTRRPRTPQKDYCSLPLLDLNMQVIKKILPRPVDQRSKNARGQIFQGRQRIFYWEPEYDTVYTVTPKGSAIPTHTIACSKNKETTNIRYVAEYGKYFFISGFDHDERYEVVYDQEKQTMFRLNNGPECDTSGKWISPTFTNDLFGIEPVFIQGYDPGIRRYIAWVFPEAISDSYDLACIRSKKVRYPKIRDEIIRISHDKKLSENRLMILLKPVD